MAGRLDLALGAPGRSCVGAVALALMLGGAGAAAGAEGAPAVASEVTRITTQWVEHRVAPVGLDNTTPRFSWQEQAARPGARQTAYQLQVARGAAAFDDAAKSLAWDSGWVPSDQSHLVAYAGAPLRSSTAYFWRVRIKDENGRVSSWSPTARWVTGLLDADHELRADWIGYDTPDPETPHGDDWFEIGRAQWICHPALSSRSDAVAYYRTRLDLPADATRVMVGMEANFAAQLFVNGVEVFQGGKFSSVPSYLDITPWMRAGANRLGFRVNDCQGNEHAGVIASIRIEQRSGAVTHRFTDGSWQATMSPVDLWASAATGGDWAPVRVLGRPGEPNPTSRGGEKLFTPKFGSKVFLPPAVYLRKELVLRRPVRLAVFHGTAQGLYDLYVNGRRLTPSGFQPGWTQFERRLSYVTTDVTAALQPGRNALGAVLADGWFRGNLLWMGREQFGTHVRFSGQLEVEYTDGTRETFATDGSWKAAYGPLRQSDLMQGEVYDARREQAGWDRPGFDDRGWHPVVVAARAAAPTFVQRAHLTEPVRPQSELRAQRITEPRPGVYVVDFGQNFAGWVRLALTGRAGQVVYLRYGEDVRPDGTLYTDNLRGVNPADTYVCRGGDLETWEPRFTYHGFRYVQILGLTAAPTPATVTGIAANSGGPITSTFACSSPLLDRLYQNVVWSQRSNYFETMTDCPQRDERYGWVGDAYFFMPTAAYNQNAASFFNKWFHDCLDTQRASTGNISNGAPGNRPGGGVAQLDWSAAAIVTPWLLWQRYGDAEPIRERYDALRSYMRLWEQFAVQVDAVPARRPPPYRIIGDWVALEKGTTREFIGRVLGYVLCQHMADFARLTGHADDVTRFDNLAAHFRAETLRRDVTPEGRVTGDTETAYALVCRYGLYEPAQEALVRANFHRRMEADEYHVLTGFHGTGNLLPGLTMIGLAADASRTLLNQTGPGWGSMVRRGATTIWERWEGKADDGSFFSPQMNSFNHYTFGGCGEWMMGYLVGLRAETPGFKTVHVEPTVVPDLTWASGSFESPYGTISNRWERSGRDVVMRLVIPPNADARVVLPRDAQGATLGGVRLDGAPAGGFSVGAGTHEFRWSE